MQTSLGLLIVLHIVFLVLVANSPILRHPASLAAGVLAIVGIGTAMVASFYEHTRSVAPSSILQTYFLAVILLDMTRVRTLWLIDNSPPAVLLSFVLIVIASTEERSGLRERALFSWLLSMLRRGYSSTLSLNCLPVIDSKLDSQTLHDNLLNSWRLSKRTDY
jgi:ATP-binding cassette subfamily C (CFTR/MRP) protein 1